jgi:hypothetical protein
MEATVNANPATPHHCPRLRGDYAAAVPPAVAKHLDTMAEDVPPELLSDHALVALLLIATASGADHCPRITVDAYQKANGCWTIECHRSPWQESRFSPAGWETMYRRDLAHDTTHGNMPLAEIWMEVSVQIAGERTDNMLLDAREQWAESPAEGGDPDAR